MRKEKGTQKQQEKITKIHKGNKNKTKQNAMNNKTNII